MVSDKTRAESLPIVQEALGKNTSNRIPVWFMRQAGRYLPEYMAIRAKMEFTELCRNPAAAAEVTLQPLRRFDLDAAIIFSDILIPCTAIGQELTFGKGHGPKLTPAMDSRQVFAKFARPDAKKQLGYVGDAIATTRAHLAPGKALIGFSGAPFTVGTYMIEGGSSKDFTATKGMLFRDPELFRDLMKHLRDVTVDYLLMQVEAGADMLMVFDTWAGNLTPRDYFESVWPVTSELLATVRAASGIPVIYFSGQGSDRIPGIVASGAPPFDVLSIDWRVDLAHAASMVSAKPFPVAFQGNLDPQILLGSEDQVRARVRELVAAISAAKATGAIHGHIFNVGHGLLPHTRPESISWVIDEIRKLEAGA